MLVAGIAGIATAGEIKFRTRNDLSSNFDVKNLSGAFAVTAPAKGSPPALVFTGPKNVTAVLVRRSPTGGAPDAGGPATPVTAEFQMTAAGTSFGVIVHGTSDHQDGYLVLVNTYPKNGGTIRVFRTPVWPQQQQAMKLLAQKPVRVELNQWLRLTVNSADSAGEGPVLRVRLAPADGGSAKPAELAAEDPGAPLPASGGVALRFYSSEEGTKTLVRSLSVGPPAAAKKPAGDGRKKGA
jgi:hypothetical protein